MEQYTTPTPLPQRQTHLGGSGEALEEPATVGEPMHVELLAAIHGARVALEEKIETVAVKVKVNLLRADLPKVSEKVKVAAGSIVDLQTERSVDSDSVSRIEIQQDGTMAVVDPEQAVVLAGSSDMEAGVLSVDS
ncbi:hypothetical protein NDU88_001636 [Pleurodeles waltl]|uniref:Uncharacterized protein n=1 Tax=Pleurodeles waltl TaxID=8319 RepID=A0AAV7T041_PLEWA|nr:hypothetical protein NDU88_001636 [Pleurodeles waltl]